jgi:DNA (cytosine-5)-methyltransferase 1
VTANSYHKKPGGAAPLGVIAPVLTYGQQGGGNRSVEDPHHTVTASAKDQNAVIAPTLVQTGYGERVGQAPRSLDIEAPLGTVVAGGVKHALAVPTLVGCGGRAGQSRPRGGDEPSATITAKADVCVAAAFLAQHNTGLVGHGVDEPVSTVVNKGCTQGVVSAFVSRQFGTSIGHGMDEPTHTATAGVNKSMLVAPHLMTMRNAGKPFNEADKPAHTVTAGGAGMTVVAPFMQKYYGTGNGARVDEPSHTVTVKDRFGYVEGEPVPEHLSEAQIARAKEVADFMRAHGFWDEREFVTVDVDGETFTIVDIGMRMLTPRELFSAQGFPPDYIIDLEFNGKPLPKDAQISCCGNSVSPYVAYALAGSNCGHLAVWREAAE